MPRVSAAHLAARRQQILDAARACFLRNGFHQTSMQDVIAAAGLSVGAVYRYFRSKNDIVEAIAVHYATEIGGEIAGLADGAHRPLAEVMAEAVRIMDANIGPDGPMRLAVQVWAEAVRDARMAEIAERVYTALRDHFVRIARRAVERGDLAPQTDPQAAGAALFSLIVGYGVQHLLTGRPDRDSYTAGLSALLAPQARTGAAPVAAAGAR
jgi:AcrR family transcriptional regulator